LIVLLFPLIPIGYMSYVSAGDSPI